MLDFYLIEDHKSKPDSPGQTDLKFIGGLNADTFERLQRKGVFQNPLDYYSDFRLSHRLVKQMKQHILEKQFQFDTDVKKLLSLLDIAEKAECGLIAYGD